HAVPDQSHTFAVNFRLSMQVIPGVHNVIYDVSVQFTLAIAVPAEIKSQGGYTLCRKFPGTVFKYHLIGTVAVAKDGSGDAIMLAGVGRYKHLTCKIYPVISK